MQALMQRPEARNRVAIDFRAQINARLKKLNITVNQFCVLLENRPSRNVVYSFLSGKSDMGSENLARLLEVLDVQEKKKPNNPN